MEIYGRPDISLYGDISIYMQIYQYMEIYGSQNKWR